MGKCLSKDKNGGATAPAPVKLNGAYAHITVRELRQERFPSGKAGRQHDASSLGRPVHETQYKGQDVTEGLNVAPSVPCKRLGTEDDKAVLSEGAAQGGGVLEVRETSSAEATVTHSLGLQRKDTSPDFAKEVNGLGLDAGLASASDSGSGLSGVPEQLVVLPPVQVSRSQSPSAGVRRGEQRRRPSMSSTEFAGHFSDFDYPSPPRLEAIASAESTVESPSSSPVKSVKEFASVKSSLLVKSTPTKSEVKPTKSGRHALKDISLNAPPKREQAHKRQLSKSPVLQGLTLTQEEAIPHQQAAKSLPTDIMGTRAAKRSRDWSTVPDDFSGITSMEHTDKEALLTPAAQQTNISITLNVDIDSGSKGHSSISLRHEETLATEGNTSVTTTLSTSPKLAPGTGISSGPILLTPPTASCHEGWLISSLILDQDKGAELQSKNLGAMDFPSLDSVSHALPDTQVDGSDVCVLAVETEADEPIHCQVEEQSCVELQGSEDPATNSFNQDQVGNLESVIISDENSIPEADEPLGTNDGGEPSMPLPSDPSESPVQEAGDSGSALGALPDMDDGSLEVISTDSDAAQRLLLDNEQKVEPGNLIEQASNELSEQEEHVAGNDGADQRQKSSLQAEPICEEDLVGGTEKEGVCQEVPAFEKVCVKDAQDVGVGERVVLEAGSAVLSLEESPETVVPSLLDDGMESVPPIQLCGTNMEANCIAKEGADDARPVVAAPQVTEPLPLEASGNALFDGTKMVDVEVSGYASSHIGSPSQIEGFELTVEVVNSCDEQAVIGLENGNFQAMEAAGAEEIRNITVEGFAADKATEVKKELENAYTASSIVSAAAFGSPFKEYPVYEDTDADPPSSIPSAAVSSNDATSPSDISSGAFGSPFKEYVVSLQETEKASHESQEEDCDNSDDYEELRQTSESARNSLESEAQVPVSVTGKPTEQSCPHISCQTDAASLQPDEQTAVSILPSPNKIPLQPSSDSFLVKLPPASKRTSSLPFIPRPPRPEKRVNESQVSDILSSLSDRPQRLSTSAPSSPQGPIFDLSQYSLPSTPGDSCARRSSVDSRGSEGLIFDLSQFSLPSTPLSMSARSSPMSHSSTPKKLGHANAIALTPEEIAEIWGAFEQGSHAASPAAV